MFGLFKKDPEVERIMIRLAEQLEDLTPWRAVNGDEISHDLYNVRIDHRRILSPDLVWVPMRWRRQFKRKIQELHRVKEVSRLGFVFDNIDGKYPYYVNDYNQEHMDWLEINANEKDYIIISYSGNSHTMKGIYFIDAEIAMAFKLVFTE